MKNLVTLLCLPLLVSVSYATYTYTITEYQTLPDLTGTQSMLITGNGGGGKLDLLDESFIRIENTSTLKEGEGGVWQIRLAGISNLYMKYGEVHEIDFNNNATAILRGGLIESIYSYQAVNNPHITLYYSGDLPEVQDVGGYDFLVGQWGNGDPFSIYLHDTGYDAYGNFNFVLIPEPASLLLMGLGGLLLRRRLRV